MKFGKRELSIFQFSLLGEWYRPGRDSVSSLPFFVAFVRFCGGFSAYGLEAKFGRKIAAKLRNADLNNFQPQLDGLGLSVPFEAGLTSKSANED